MPIAIEQGITFWPCLILDNDRRRAKPLQRAYGEGEMFRQPASIAIENQRFGGDLEKCVDGCDAAAGGIDFRVN